MPSEKNLEEARQAIFSVPSSFAAPMSLTQKVRKAATNFNYDFYHDDVMDDLWRYWQKTGRNIDRISINEIVVFIKNGDYAIGAI